MNKKKSALDKENIGCLIAFIAAVVLALVYGGYWLYDNWAVLMVSEIHLSGEDIFRGILELLLYVTFVAAFYWLISKVIDH